jgi:capsular exopolysaccharide synthesis family protein
MMALNLSLAYASMGKRVLLVGADLRNPQIHSYMDLDKSGPGLSDYLKNTWFGFHDGVQRGVKQSPNHEVYLSGAIPASAPVLLSNPRFGEFIQDAKKEYDYVVVDTAPTMLVTDTLLISNHADATLFVLRSGVTDKNLLQFSKELHRNKKLTNMAYVVNAVGKVKDRKYNYGYAYGYNA